MSAQDDLVRAFVGPGEALSLTSSSVQSVLFPAATKSVRVVATVDCFVEIGANPTAVANTSTFVPAGTVEYFAATFGQRLAMIRSAVDGTAYVRETN